MSEDLNRPDFKNLILNSENRNPSPVNEILHLRKLIKNLELYLKELKMRENPMAFKWEPPFYALDDYFRNIDEIAEFNRIAIEHLFDGVPRVKAFLSLKGYHHLEENLFEIETFAEYERFCKDRIVEPYGWNSFADENTVLDLLNDLNRHPRIAGDEEYFSKYEIRKKEVLWLLENVEHYKGKKDLVSHFIDTCMPDNLAGQDIDWAFKTYLKQKTGLTPEEY